MSNSIKDSAQIFAVNQVLNYIDKKPQEAFPKEYYQRYTNQKWGAAENFHITLDSGALGIDACVDLLARLY